MIIAVDFDGTVVDHCFPKVGQNAPNAVEVLTALHNKGHKLILWTMRSNNQEGKFLDDAVKWFKKNDIPLFGIQRNPEQDEWTSSPKAYAQIYIDDAALGAPLMSISGFNRKCVDWLKVEKYFKDIKEL